MHRWLTPLGWCCFPVWLLLLNCNEPESGNGPAPWTFNIYAPVGHSARHILSAEPYKKLVVEIDYMPGCKPDVYAVDHVRHLLDTLCNKPGGVSVVLQPVAGLGKRNMDVQQVAQVEELNRSFFTHGDVLTLYIIIINGEYPDANVFAQAYYNTSIAIFGKGILENSGGAGQVSRGELLATVMEHSLGHLMGLVGQGTPQVTPHQQALNGYHCDNPDCIMYSNGEGKGIISFVSSSGVPLFDTNCRNDLKANGGK